MLVHKRGGTSQIKHDHTLRAEQAKFVNTDLSNSSNTTLIKKFITPNIPEETELGNPNQKTLIMGHEHKIEQSDQKGSPAQIKNGPY